MTAVPTVYRTTGGHPGGGYTLSPFAAQHERRIAVYFRAYSPAQRALRRMADEAKVAAMRALAARTVDQVRLGEMQSERNHDLKADISYPVIYRGRNGRDARAGGYFEFPLKVQPGMQVLRATYWGDERDRVFSSMAARSRGRDCRVASPVRSLTRTMRSPDRGRRGMRRSS